VTAYVALLRAVNVGGRQLKMDDLKRIAGELGLKSPRTFIASGNLLFASGKAEAAVKRELESALTEHMGKPVEVMVRSAKEMADAVAANPFSGEPGNRVAAIFFDAPPAADAIDSAKNIVDERLARAPRKGLRAGAFDPVLTRRKRRQRPCKRPPPPSTPAAACGGAGGR